MQSTTPVGLHPVVKSFHLGSNGEGKFLKKRKKSYERQDWEYKLFPYLLEDCSEFLPLSLRVREFFWDVCLCATCPVLPEVRRRPWIPWNWSSRRLWTIPWSPVNQDLLRAGSVLATEPSLQPDFSNVFIFSINTKVYVCEVYKTRPHLQILWILSKSSTLLSLTFKYVNPWGHFHSNHHGIWVRSWNMYLSVSGLPDSLVFRFICIRKDRLLPFMAG